MVQLWKMKMTLCHLVERGGSGGADDLPEVWLELGSMSSHDPESARRYELSPDRSLERGKAGYGE